MKFLVKAKMSLKVFAGCGKQCAAGCTNLGSCFCPLK